MTNQQSKIFSVLGCLFSDIALSLWLYYRASNYSEYEKYASTITDSPDFQLQLYQVYMQSLIFGLMLFILAHMVIYLMLWREYRPAQVYLKFYTICSSAGCLLLALTETFFALVPMLIYGLSYYYIARSIPPKHSTLRK